MLGGGAAIFFTVQTLKSGKHKEHVICMTQSNTYPQQPGNGAIKVLLALWNGEVTCSDLFLQLRPSVQSIFDAQLMLYTYVCTYLCQLY